MNNKTSTNNKDGFNTPNVDVTKINYNNRKKYSSYEFIIIGLTALLLILGFLLRAWRIIREGMPIAFDGYHFQKIAKQIFFEGWYDFSLISRDLPGIYFILVIAEHLLGTSGMPIMWSIFVFPQIVCSLQLVIFYVLTRRLTKSRTISLMTMFCMTFVGLIVYRNQNVAPEIFVLGLVPFVAFFIGRYFDTFDTRFLLIGILITCGIIMIHHLTTLIVITLWHILIFYNFIFHHVKRNSKKIKKSAPSAIILLLLDVFVILFWQFVLKGYPFNFIRDTTTNLFKGGRLVAIILTIIGVTLFNTITFSIFFYNFDKKKINTGIIIGGVLALLVIFTMGAFFGGSTPDLTLVTIFIIGTPAFVLPPLGAYGITKISRNDVPMSRVTRGWLFTIALVISVTVIFPILTSLVARLALYIIPVGVLLASMGIIYLLRKVKLKNLKVVVLTLLIGSMALTMTYAYPAPKNNFNQQEIYQQAEFNTIDYLVLYRYSPNNTVFRPDTEILVDTDLRISLIVEGYSGIDTTFCVPNVSWVIEVFYLKDDYNYTNYIISSSPKLVNNKISFIYISQAMFIDGFHSGWADYGTDKDNWIIPLPDITPYLPLNPYINRIYDTRLTYLLMPI